MQIKFKIPKAHVCQDNMCFKITFVLVKNMIDIVIFGNPFMCLLYLFITDSEGITIHPFGQPARFKFLRPFVQHISYIEPHLVHITDPLVLAMELLPTSWHFIPKSPEKNIKFYKGILTQEKSARVENIMDCKNLFEVLYHKFIIQSFVSCKDWDTPPHSEHLQYSRDQNPSTIIMIIWTPSKRFCFTRTKTMIIHGSCCLTKSSPAQFFHGSLSDEKCLDQFLITSLNPFRMH